MEADASYRGVTAAVLGASGFIGRWVARHLSGSGADVVAIVRDASTLSRSARQELVRVIEADVSTREAVREAIGAVRPTIVFNLAGYGVDRGERDERVAQQINAELPAWIVETFSVPDDAWSGQRVVHVGSALEYGEIRGDLAEDSRPHPTTLYGRTKLAGTLAFADACAKRGIRGLTARLFTVYGDGEHAGRLLPTLIHAARSDGAVPLSAGLQRRDFTYVEDVADGLLRLGRCATAQPGEIVNLATGRLTTVRDFATEAARVLGIHAERLAFGALPTRSEEMEHEPVSVARLRKLVGWVPTTSIATGAARSAEMSGAS